MARKENNLDQPVVLIISDDPESSRAITARWQTERAVPAFTLMSAELCQCGLETEDCDLVIVAGIRPDALGGILKTLSCSTKPVLVVSPSDQAMLRVREMQSKVTVLRRHDGWLDTVVLVAGEVLRRNHAVARAEAAEQSAAALECQATLGRYMLEMRHSLNNALTSVLGNSELLLLEPGELSATARAQIDTIRHMALRMHEILQRFSSLEKELSFTEPHAGRENQEKLRSAATGA
jgi:signal transduction histidine kinase